MNKKVYFAPQSKEMLSNIKFEFMAGSLEEGGYMDDSDANKARFEEDDDFELDGNTNLWDR